MNRLVALLLLIVLLPICLLLSLLVFIFLGSPVIFKQQRPGLKGRVFTLYKFRSMNNATSKRDNLLPDDKRLDKFGKFLRSTSLDELPSLLNIVKGEMNFIGPRPLLVEYLLRYSKQQIRRHEVKPGITGWAQVNGRNAISWEDKFKHDVWYVDNRSFWLDVKILFLTIKKVFACEYISADNEATMAKFLGNKK